MMVVRKGKRSPVATAMILSIVLTIVTHVLYLYYYGDSHVRRFFSQVDEDRIDVPPRRHHLKSVVDIQALRQKQQQQQQQQQQRLAWKKDPKVALAEKKLSETAIARLPPDDYRSCTSPEKDGVSVALFGGQLQTIVEQHIEPLLSLEKDRHCKDLVVLGVAFGEEFLRHMNATWEERGGTHFNSTQLLEEHGHCFFMFTLEEHVETFRNASDALPRSDPILLGHTWLIPIPQTKLPYRNNRRNAKLLKYMGQNAFPNTTTIVWQDAKFFRPNSIFDRSIPTHYSNLWQFDKSKAIAPCVTTMALPIHVSSFFDIYEHVSIGETSRFDTSNAFQDHCMTIISALRDRPNVTDNPRGLLRQCQAYLRNVMQSSPVANNHTTRNAQNPLNFGLIDSAFIIWNESTEQCRDFNSHFRGSVLDQIHCHSDRDQIVLPFILYRLLSGQAERIQHGDAESSLLPKLQAVYRPNGDAGTDSPAIPVDSGWHSRYHDLDFVSTSAPTPTVWVRTIRSACHWYHTSPLGKDPDRCFRKDWLKFDTMNDTATLLAAVIANNNVNKEESVSGLSLSQLKGQMSATAGVMSSSAFQKCSRMIARNDNASRCVIDDSFDPFHIYMRKIQKQIIQPLLAQCSQLVVFGTAFDVKMIRRLNPGQLLYKQMNMKRLGMHGKCFFTLVSEEHVMQLKLPTDSLHNETAVYFGDQWLIPIDRSMLTEKYLQQNGIFFKYMSASLFPGVSRVIWQSSAFFKYLGAQPQHYRDLVGAPLAANSCVTAFAMPDIFHQNSTTLSDTNDNLYMKYCKHLLLANASQPHLEQCDEYIQRVYQRELSVEYLSRGLVDSDFLIWNDSTESCRAFNEQLRCQILKELQCRVGPDTLVFPFALYQLNLQTEYRKRPPIAVNEDYMRRIHDVKFVRTATPLSDDINDSGSKGNRGPLVKRYTGNDRNEVMTTTPSTTFVTVVRTLCHWNIHRRVGEGCPAFRGDLD
jgi:hypothetical protein